jgi:very-short-patch-repair endonuclease
LLLAAETLTRAVGAALSLEGRGPVVDGDECLKPARTKLDQTQPRLRVAEEVAYRTKQASKQLRQRETPSEKLMWDALRARRFRGLKFRRQQQIGPFVVDFYCAELRLVVEIDGRIHDEDEQRRLDTSRQGALEEIDILVVRIPAEIVMQDLASAIAILGSALDANPRSKLPSPLEGEGLGVRVSG